MYYAIVKMTFKLNTHHAMSDLLHALSTMGTGRTCAVCARYVAYEDDAQLTGCVTAVPHVAHKACVRAWVAAVCGTASNDGPTPCIVCRTTSCLKAKRDTVVIDVNCGHCVDWYMAAIRPSVRPVRTDINTTNLPFRVEITVESVDSNDLFPHVRKEDGSWGRNGAASTIDKVAKIARKHTIKRVTKV